MDEFKIKVNKIRMVLAQKNIYGLLITQQKNFSWLTSGRAFINSATEKAVASILITSDKTVLLTNNIEAGRLVEEEITGSFDHFGMFEWFDPNQAERLLHSFTGGEPVETDVSLDHELLPLRTVLTDDEFVRIQQAAKDTAEAIEETAFQISQGESEYQISAKLASCCLRRGIEPIVNLVAVDERIYSRRHPLPTSKRLSKYAMVVVCGRRRGQVVSATRLVHFGTPPADLQHRHRAVLEIDGSLIGCTIPGISFADLLAIMKKSYADVGFPDQWKKHHQGGLAGYLTREKLLLPGNADTVVQDRQVYAWNPSIDGVKSEDTLLVVNSLPHILTSSGEFPTIPVHINNQLLHRPDILVRKHHF